LRRPPPLPELAPSAAAAGARAVRRRCRSSRRAVRHRCRSSRRAWSSLPAGGAPSTPPPLLAPPLLLTTGEGRAEGGGEGRQRRGRPAWQERGGEESRGGEATRQEWRPGGGDGGSEGGEVWRWCRLSVWVGGLFAVCPRSRHTANSLPCVFLLDTRQMVCLSCARKFAHGKNLDTRQTTRFP